MKERIAERTSAIKKIVGNLLKRENGDITKAAFNTLSLEVLPILYKLCQENGTTQARRQKSIILGIGKASKKFEIVLNETATDKSIFISDLYANNKIRRVLIFKETTFSSALKNKGNKRSKFTPVQQLDFLTEVRNADFNPILTVLGRINSKTS